MDQSKAFDRIDHRFLAAVLGAARLGPTFRSRIAALYSDIESVVRAYDFLLKSFEIKLSIYRRCPVSPFLYVLVLELLL